MPRATQGTEVYRTTSWSAGVGHVTFTNASDGLAPEDSFACSSNATNTTVPRADEVICYRLDGAEQVLVVAPVMTNVAAAGGGDSYSKLPKANGSVNMVRYSS